MKLRLAAVGALVCALVFMVGAESVAASAQGVVISEFRTRGPVGAADELVELYNASGGPVAIGGWLVRGSNSGGSVSTRATIPAGTILGAGCHYLVTNASTSGGPYSGSVPGDLTYTVGITDDGGIGLTLADGTTIVDAAGMSAGSAFKEGTPLASFGSTNSDRSYERKPGGPAGNGTDSDDNLSDFQAIAPSIPQNTLSPCVSGDAPPAVASTTPADGAANVPLASNVDISFSEPVDVTGPWFSIDCSTSGAHSAAVSGGPTTYALDPNADFVQGDACTVTIFASGVTDAGGQPMAADYSFGFTTPAVAAAGVTISEVYGGGGNSGATLTNDFIELFNTTGAPISLAGWSVQYASAAGTTWQVTALGGSIPAGRNYLVQEGAGAGGTQPLPGPDAGGSIAMSATNGKVALVSSTTALTGACPTGAQIVDFVGYGSSATCFEGGGPTATLSNTTSAQRIGGGATDTDDNAADFVVGAPDPHGTHPAVASSSPAPGASGVALDANVVVTFSEPVGVSGDWFSIVCATSGAHPASVSGGPTTYLLDPGTDFAGSEPCTVTVFATGVMPNLAADHAFSFTTIEPLVCGDPATPVHDVQGNGATSPLVGQTHTIEGIVVGDFQATDQFGGFYVQEEDADSDADPATSEGIFVFSTLTDVAAGDVVRVRGRVTEFPSGTPSLTELTNVSAIAVCATGATVAATDVMLPVASVDAFERYEGMLVRLPQTLVISEYFNYDRFGELVLARPLNGESRPFTPTGIDEPGGPALARLLANQLRRITLDDGLGISNPPSLRHPNGAAFSLTNRFRGGDTVQNTVGVLGFDFGLYRIQPTGPADYAAANPRPAEPELVGERLRVAAMNTLNFFITGDFPSGNPLDNACGPARTLECRGHDADQPTEFTRQRDKLLAALAGLNADVIGLNELENTTDVDPLEGPSGIVPGLNAMLGAGTYAAIDTGTIGTDAIRVGLIYKPAEVMPVGDFELLTTADDPRFLDTKSRPVLAQTFEEIATGARFTVAVNHLKSKGSDCNDVGDPDLEDGQGNCNVTRTLAAQALVDWLATDPTGSGDADFLIMGDLNSYAMEDPIDAIKVGPDDTAGTDDDYTNLVAQFLGAHAYSFVFDGMSGYLDHALSNGSLTPQVTGVAEWHINADEPDILDYDTSFKPDEQDALYEANAFRASDHDPIVVGLDPTITFDELCRLTRRSVEKSGIAGALCEKLATAEAADAIGDTKTKDNAINSYVKQVEAQTGKSITPANAEVLIELAQSL